MIKKLLPFFLLAFIFTNSAYAQTNIAETYTGNLKVKMGALINDVVPDLQELIDQQFPGGIDGIPVVLEETSTDRYTLGLPFDLGNEFPIEIGDMNIKDIIASQSGNSISLSKSGLTTGPKIPIPENMKAALENLGIRDNIELFYRFDTGNHTNGKLSFQISVVIKLVIDIDLLTVNFSQNSVGIGEYTDNSLSIYSSLNSDIITIVGADDNSYSIYNVNGALIQSGNVESGLVNVANITSGVYFIKVDNKTAKFIR